MPVVRSLADQVAGGIATRRLSSFDAMLKFCELCVALRNRNILCDMHKSFITVPETCNVCQNLNPSFESYNYEI